MLKPFYCTENTVSGDSTDLNSWLFQFSLKSQERCCLSPEIWKCHNPEHIDHSSSECWSRHCWVSLFSRQIESIQALVYSWDNAYYEQTAVWTRVSRSSCQYKIQNCHFAVQHTVMGRYQHASNNETTVCRLVFFSSLSKDFISFPDSWGEEAAATVPAVLAALRFNLWYSGTLKHVSLSLLQTQSSLFPLPANHGQDSTYWASFQNWYWFQCWQEHSWDKKSPSLDSWVISFYDL